MDRYRLIDSTELDEALATWPMHEAQLRRAEMAESAYQAWETARSPGDTRSLADFQQVAIDEQLRKCVEARARIAASRERLAAPPLPPLKEDDPASLEAHGFPFRAARLRRERADAEHSARRKRIEAEVSSQDRLHDTLRRIHGTDEADRLMGGGAA